MSTKKTLPSLLAIAMLTFSANVQGSELATGLDPYVSSEPTELLGITLKIEDDEEVIEIEADPVR